MAVCSKNFSTEVKMPLTVLLAKETDDLLKEAAKSKRWTKSEIVREALSLYFSKGVNDKDLIYAAINDGKRKIEYIDKKIESFFNLWFFSLTTIFSALPDISSKSEAEQNLITKTAIKRKNAMFTAFKKTIKEQPSLFQSLFADYVEHEGSIK